MRDLFRFDGPARRPLMLRAAMSVLLSLLFVLVYGSTNWLTAQRPSADVQTWSFAWESSVIPYVPILIVPYMSMDLFFFLAAFLCRDARELWAFAKRVVFAIVTAAVFFLVMPLKLDWPARPQLEGWFGDFVETSCTAPFLMEYPHNLFPSLHIILCMIVADIHVRRTRGIVRVCLCTWFCLIGISTLFTWQHHIVDVLGAMMIASFTFYLFRETDPPCPASPNPRIGAYYAAGALMTAMIMPALGLWGVFLLWPVGALAITAAGYFGLGPAIYRKAAGQLPWSTHIVLAPVLLGHYLSLIYYRHQSRAWDEVVPGVFIGRALNRNESEQLIHHGVTAVLDLTAEFSETAAFSGLRYLNLPILDLTAPTQDQLQQAVTFIAQESAHGAIYVHCKAGYSRSACVICAYLVYVGIANTPVEAIAFLRAARPAIVIRPEVMRTLRTMALFSSNDVTAKRQNS